MQRLLEENWKKIALLLILILALYSLVNLTNQNNGVLSEARAAVKPRNDVGRYQVERLSEDTFIILNTATSETKLYSFKKRTGRIERNGIRLEAEFEINSNLPDYTDYDSKLYGQQR